jgi:hypothetical protein
MDTVKNTITFKNNPFKLYPNQTKSRTTKRNAETQNEGQDYG